MKHFDNGTVGLVIGLTSILCSACLVLASLGGAIEFAHAITYPFCGTPAVMAEQNLVMLWVPLMVNLGIVRLAIKCGARGPAVRDALILAALAYLLSILSVRVFPW